MYSSIIMQMTSEQAAYNAHRKLNKIRVENGQEPIPYPKLIIREPEKSDDQDYSLLFLGLMFGVCL